MATFRCVDWLGPMVHIFESMKFQKGLFDGHGLWILHKVARLASWIQDRAFAMRKNFDLL